MPFVEPWNALQDIWWLTLIPFSFRGWHGLQSLAIARFQTVLARSWDVYRASHFGNRRLRTGACPDR